ncbi:hypothetical protein Ais01nite_33660 [Asanoa ishikariensis]|uniref:Uncharacterized protein n=1 Tax=Asanoa ishikariensis TaxID=137265 RepID=A0A1H3LA59_9ACTN|nr:hypothetical protein Ais01nite_33660 [Asanoa ishikariensis]SDY60844.1 hypothetical protein SAMN05421684_0611 [Asanoa ishikariensis]
MFYGKPPDPARVEAWNRSYLEHGRNPNDPTRCAIAGCLGRFPCAFRVEAAELLIVAGIDLPDPRHGGRLAMPAPQTGPHLEAHNHPQWSAGRRPLRAGILRQTAKGISNSRHVAPSARA